MHRRLPALAAPFLIAAALAALPGSARAAGLAGAPASAASEAGVELSIRFYDKRIYFPESEIALKVTVTNGSPSTYRFKLAEDRLYSLSFDARTPTNRALDASDERKLALSASKPVFYREIAVEPGEEYSFVERLERYVRIEGPGSYTVRASFWPELSQRGAAPQGAAAAGVQAPGAAPLESNVLILSVRPSPGLPPASEAIRPETGEVMKPEAVPPDEVVRRTIVARQRSRWSEYFLYLDLESLLSRNEDKKRAYDRESDEGRRRMLEKYKADLRESVVDEDISVVPASFEIVETRYAANSGVVRVLAKFDYKSFMMRKEYDYELRRRDDVWYIVGYTVVNKGTE